MDFRPREASQELEFSDSEIAAVLSASSKQAPVLAKEEPEEQEWQDEDWWHAEQGEGEMAWPMESPAKWAKAEQEEEEGSKWQEPRVGEKEWEKEWNKEWGNPNEDSPRNQEWANLKSRDWVNPKSQPAESECEGWQDSCTSWWRSASWGWHGGWAGSRRGGRGKGARGKSFGKSKGKPKDERGGEYVVGGYKMPDGEVSEFLDRRLAQRLGEPSVLAASQKIVCVLHVWM